MSEPFALPWTSTPDELVTIGWAYGLPETAVVVSRLEAAGVNVLADTRHLASLTWHWAYALGGITLRVPLSQAPLAHEILAEFEPSRPRRTMAHLLLAALVFALAGIPPPASGLFIGRPWTLSVARSRSGDPDT